MKELLLILLLTLPITLAAQNLSANQLLAIYNKDEEQTDTYLEQRGWERTQSEDPVVKKTWAFGHAMMQNSMEYGAEAWLSRITTDVEGLAISYTFPSQEKFAAFRQQMLAMGMKRVAYTSDNKEIVATYQGANYQIKLYTTLRERLDDNNTYALRLTHR